MGERMSAHIPRHSVTIFPLPSTQHSLNKGPQLRLLDFCSQAPAFIYSLHLLVTHHCCVTNYPQHSVSSSNKFTAYYSVSLGKESRQFPGSSASGSLRCRGFSHQKAPIEGESTSKSVPEAIDGIQFFISWNLLLFLVMRASP